MARGKLLHDYAKVPQSETQSQDRQHAAGRCHMIGNTHFEGTLVRLCVEV